MGSGVLHSACIALGSNLGDRAATLRAAIDAVGELPGTRIVRVSSFHETEPVGGPAGQGRYLNAAAVIETSMAAGDLLAALLAIEASLGRERREGERNAARTIDMDILLFGDAVIDDPGVTVPHPRMQDRLFVMAPVAEIAPDWVHPVVGRTMAELLSMLIAEETMGPANVSGESR